MVKNPSANTGAAGDMDWIPWSKRSLGEGNGNPIQYCQDFPWTEEPGSLHCPWSKRLDITEHACTLSPAYLPSLRKLSDKRFIKSHCWLLVNVGFDSRSSDSNCQVSFLSFFSFFFFFYYYLLFYTWYSFFILFCFDFCF